MENKKTCLRGRRVKRKLSPMERLGLAYCRLEGLSWDEHIGPKPEGFDEAPDNVKFFIVQRHLRRIEAMVGETYLDRCRWVFDSRRSEKSFIEFQARRWERGELTLGHVRNDVTKQRGEEGRFRDDMTKQGGKEVKLSFRQMILVFLDKMIAGR